MRILGDLTEKNPDADLSPAMPSIEDRADRKRSVVGDIPLETKPTHSAELEPASTLSQSGHNGGRSSGTSVANPDRGRPRQEAPRPGGRAGAWVAILLLVIALVGMSGYGYLALRKNNISLSQLPGMARLVGTLGGRMDSTEAKLRDLAANWSGLAERVTALDQKVAASLSKSHQQTLALVAEAEGRMRAEMDNRTQVLDTRLAQVESNQAEDKSRLAQVESQMQSEVAGLRQDLRQEMAGNRDATNRDLAALHQQVDQGQSDVHALTQQITRQRVNFEANRNSTVEIAPGVSLTVLKTNVSYQRFEGYLSLTNEGRTLWLRNAGMRQAMSFYSDQADRPYDLVVTRVNRDGVVGYLLVPTANQG